MSRLAELRGRLNAWRRRVRRQIVIAIRKPFVLDEDGIRDQLVDGLRRDLNEASGHLSRTMGVVNNLSARLAYYEKTVPGIARARKDMEREVRKQIKKAKAKTEAAPAAETSTE